MVAQMGHVASNHAAERNGPGRRLPIHVTGSCELLRRHALEHVREVRVVDDPQVNERRPVRRSVLLARNPGVLVVRGEAEFFNLLRPHEPLMVVGSRVDQVAEDLELALPAGNTRGRNLRPGQPTEFGRCGGDNRSDLAGVLLVHGSS